jgi:hypothetical protein
VAGALAVQPVGHIFVGDLRQDVRNAIELDDEHIPAGCLRMSVAGDESDLTGIMRQVRF